MKKKKKDRRKENAAGGKPIEKAGLAIKNEFYLEASWILSSIIETRLKKILEKVENEHPGNGFTLEQTIKRVKHLHVADKHPLLAEHFTVIMLDEIRNWKNQRNTILKDMQDVHVSHARLERLALEGIRLLKKLNKAYKSFKSGLETREVKEPG
jgi:hypothetical protein